MQDQITKASGDKIFLKCVGELRDEDDRSTNAVLLFKEKEKKNPENQCFVQTNGQEENHRCQWLWMYSELVR